MTIEDVPFVEAQAILLAQEGDMETLWDLLATFHERELQELVWAANRLATMADYLLAWRRGGAQ